MSGHSSEKNTPWAPLPIQVLPQWTVSVLRDRVWIQYRENQQALIIKVALSWKTRPLSLTLGLWEQKYEQWVSQAVRYSRRDQLWLSWRDDDEKLIQWEQHFLAGRRKLIGIGLWRWELDQKEKEKEHPAGQDAQSIAKCRASLE